MRFSLAAKLLLAQLPLVLAIILTELVALQTIGLLGQSSHDILKDNYRSVLAMERMESALDRLFAEEIAFCESHAAADRSPERTFARELATQEGNITEAGELEATKALRVSWESFLLAHDAAATSPAVGFACLERSQIGAERVRAALSKILDLNQDAMVQKSERAERLARTRQTIMLASFFAALALAIYAAVALTQRLLRPVGVLSQAARRLGSGDFAARAMIHGKDEIAALAREFNTMADHLASYRTSSLGDLLQAQQLTQAAIDALPDPVLLLKADGELLGSNDKAESTLSLASRAATGPVYTALDEPLRGAVQKAALHVLGGKGGYTPSGYEEAVAVEGSDGIAYFLPRANPVYDESGAISGAALVLQDITRLRRFDELRSDLVATIAHEFRTPLTSLRMSLYILLEQTVGMLTDKQTELLDAASHDTERLQGLVEELLELSRIEHGQLEMQQQPIAPARLAADVTSRSHRRADEAHVSVKNLVSPFLPEVSADPDRAPLILDNLLSNAVRHSSPGTTVLLQAQLEGSTIRFEVTDTGPGIAPEHRERIFEKFYRVPGKAAGSAGLGLYIAREIVRNHGGEIGAESSPSGGSTFWFTLPLSHPP